MRGPVFLTPAEPFVPLLTLTERMRVLVWRRPFNVADVWQDEETSIRVCVRKRPMLRVEQLRHDFDVCCEDRHQNLVVLEPKSRVDLTKEIAPHRFTFDAVFNEVDGNDRIYAATLAPLLAHVFTGGHATVFAFGQTGSGKTCTMAGHGNESVGDGNARGLYELAAHDVSKWARHQGVDIGVSFFEVYRGQVLDLLNERGRLEVLEDGRGRVHLPGLVEVGISEPDELLALVKQAEELRAVGATSANEQSSRSHAILQVVLRARADRRGIGKLSLVDLAGSERAADASSKDRQTRIEGAEINKSLLCLKECIRALDSGASHAPFRGSKLTKVLRDSFMGRAKTVMIATVSPGSSAAENTLNTLRYAQRVKEFSTKRGGAPPGGANPGGAANRRGAVPPSLPPLGALPPAPPPAPAPAPPPAPAPAQMPRGAQPRHPNPIPLRTPPEEGMNASRRFSDTWNDEPPEPPNPTPLNGGGGSGGLVDVDDAADAHLSSGREAAAEEAAIMELSASLKPFAGKHASGVGSGGSADAEDIGQFFKSVAAVSRAEEVLIAQHREAIEADELLIQQEKVMMDDVKEVNISVDEYASALEKVLAAKFRICAELQQRLEALKETMAYEEALSARVRQVPMY